ncbi:MAG: hypothetical protein OXG44_02745 [Gammaproteobacteria bacterium]|nr:hypothetical protein [Gammaproteobacteria bacterium]
MDHTLSPKASWFDRGRTAFSRGIFLERGPVLDDVLRVLSIVRALHAAGYQRIRACGFLAPSGLYWRCLITSTDNVKSNGWDVRDSLTDAAFYTSGQKAAPFGWRDAGDLGEADLALRFVEQFPGIAARGAGFDRAYADWYAGMMVTAETGRIPVFFADYEIDISGVMVPPAPGDGRESGAAGTPGRSPDS